MTISSPDKSKRRLLPRWKPFNVIADASQLSSTISSQEHQSTAHATSYTVPSSRDLISEKERYWEQQKSIDSAIELLSISSIFGRAKDFERVGHWLQQRVPDVSGAVKDLVDSSIYGESYVWKRRLKSPRPREQIAALRSKTRVFQDDPISFVDLAFFYTVLGHSESARRAALIAERLGSSNRYVVRSLARYWIHVGDPERAHEILLKSGKIKQDPWIAASEIAVASLSQRSPRSMKVWRSSINDRSFHDYEISELSGAMATVEAVNGKNKDAVNLFRRSVLSPTENAVAQYSWARSMNVRLDPIFQKIDELHSFEGRTIELRSEGNLDAAVDSCKDWLSDEPFSTAPAQIGSFVCSLIENHKVAEFFCRTGLISNPQNSTLLNNLSVALAFQNKIEEAKKQFALSRTFSKSDSDNIASLATSGLIMFQSSQLSEGRRLYAEAINSAERSANWPMCVLAAMFWYRLEKKFQTDFKSLPAEVMRKFLKRVDDSEVSNSALRELDKNG
jgi:Flp pilus assembly protein TadD